MLKLRSRMSNFFAFLAASGALVLSTTPLASAQFGDMSSMGGTMTNSGSGLTFAVGGGLTRPLGKAYLTTTSDSKNVSSKQSDDVEFGGSLGRIFTGSLGYDLGGGLNVGAEGSLARINYKPKDFTEGGIKYDPDVYVDSLLVLGTVSYNLDLGGVAVGPVVGVGWARNKAQGIVNETKGGTTTKKEYGDKSRNKLALTAGVDASLNIGSTSLSIGYRFLSLGKANTDYDKNNKSNKTVVAFDPLRAHAGTIQAKIRF